MANSSQGAQRRLALRFVGEVQGVGFRWVSRRAANEIGLTGWVRNEWDGSVSMELQGTDAQIATFFGTFHRGWGNYPPNYIIAEKEDIEPRDDEGIFRVKF